MKQKTATITFHASHNYGSMLQAFALQQVLFKIGYDNDIIDLRTQKQLKLYNIYNKAYINDFKSIVTKILALPYRKEIAKKYTLFENFLINDLKLTKRFHSLKELENTDLKYECFISGGDQIWNTSSYDFDWSFFLPFVKQGKRISYAVSMGSNASVESIDQNKIKDYLSKYQHISVREEGTKNQINELINAHVSMELDPALLLTETEWRSKFDSKPIVKGDYIFLYSPGFKKNVYDVANLLAHKLGMKVIVSVFNFRNYKYNFENQIATGPWEFLNLLSNAKLVISGSFHALVFSTLFHIPFFAVNGNKDNRMITFLKNIDLLDRTINYNDWDHKSEKAFICDYSQANKYLIQKRKESLDYLRNSIEN